MTQNHSGHLVGPGSPPRNPTGVWALPQARGSTLALALGLFAAVRPMARKPARQLLLLPCESTERAARQEVGGGRAALFTRWKEISACGSRACPRSEVHSRNGTEFLAYYCTSKTITFTECKLQIECYLGTKQ